MAQGAIKSKPKAGVTKPVQRKNHRAAVVKPKKASLQKQQQFKKKHSAGLASMTEKSLAAKAGHLELLRGGKKDSKLADASAKQRKK